jgi:hypothetical protein
MADEPQRSRRSRDEREDGEATKTRTRDRDDAPESSDGLRSSGSSREGRNERRSKPRVKSRRDDQDDARADVDEHEAETGEEEVPEEETEGPPEAEDDSGSGRKRRAKRDAPEEGDDGAEPEDGDDDEAEPRADADTDEPEDDPADTDDEVAAEADADTDEPADEDDEREDADRPRRKRGGSSRDRPSRSRLSPARIIAGARRHVEELTGRPVTGVIGFDRSDEGWEVRVEVLELKRVPETMSILGLVQVKLDEDGELIGYRRLRRYSASQVDDG